METARLNPLNDYLFMKSFGERGTEVQLASLLNAILQKSGRGGLQSVEIVENKQLSADVIGDKSSVLDVRAVLPDGVKANIEVQLRNVGNMDRRSLFYWSREYVKGIEAGQDYINLPSVIAINIIGFDFLPLDEVHMIFHLREYAHHDCLLTDALEIHFISMVKFRRLQSVDVERNPLLRWLAFLDKNTDKQTIKKILSMDTAIKQAQARISYVAQDKEMLHAYQLREMALSDFTSGMNHARREGIAIGEQRGIAVGEQRGIAIGEQRGIAKFVANLRSMGLPVEKIAAYTQLSAEKVAAILKEQERA